MNNQTLNLAQQFYKACFNGNEVMLFMHNRGKSPSFTKVGPGRKHQQGKRNG